MENMTEKLKHHQLKVTPQRIAILEMLCQTKSHPVAETIYAALRGAYPSLSLATVYKTLDTLKRTGLIQEINVGEDRHRYDANTTPHAHMVCRVCQQVMDAPMEEATVQHSENISKLTGFQVESAQTYYFGVCQNCQTFIPQ